MLAEQQLPHTLFESLEPATAPVASEPGPDPSPTLDPGAGGPGGSADPAPASSPDPAPAPQALDLDDPRVQAAIAAQAETVANQALEQRLRGLLGEPETPTMELDPFSDDFGAQLVQVMEAVLGQRLAPVDGLLQEQQVQGFEQTINGTIGQLVGEGSEFHGLDPEGVRLLGEAFATRVDPNSPEPWNDALKQGATWLKGYLDRERQAAVLDYRRQLGEIVDTPAEPPAGGGGALQIERRSGGYDDIIARHAGRFE